MAVNGSAVALISLAMAVALGAFGAHGLEGWVGAARLVTWETAVQYQVWMSLAIWMLSRDANASLGPVIVITLGMVLFSGSLYALVLLDWGSLGAVTPIGGVLLIGGLLWAAFRMLSRR